MGIFDSMKSLASEKLYDLYNPVLEDGIYVNNNIPRDILRVCNKDGGHCQITKILEDGSEAEYTMIKKTDIAKDYSLLKSSDKLD